MIAALLGLRFLLELALLAALALGGWSVGEATWSRWLLAVALPVVAAAVWGLLLSPKARLSLPLAPRLVLELALFALAASLLWATGQRAFAVVLFVGEVVVLGALLAAGQRPGPDQQQTVV
jgi:hypothetical protein